LVNRLPKDYHKENMQIMRKREHDMQHKIEEEKNAPKSNITRDYYHIEEPWKMRRFMSVESKVPQYVSDISLII